PHPLQRRSELTAQRLLLCCSASPALLSSPAQCLLSCSPASAPRLLSSDQPPATGQAAPRQAPGGTASAKHNRTGVWRPAAQPGAQRSALECSPANQVKAGSVFDNILICDDPEYARK
ncbi:hypothetical protein ACJX0J_042053, partial [Zea mays]